jgi:hypothetical protein
MTTFNKVLEDKSKIEGKTLVVDTTNKAKPHL